MAKRDTPQEGIDFEWVKGPGGAKTRSFFTMAEKNKRKESGGGSPVKSGSGGKGRTKVLSKPAPEKPRSEVNPRPKSRPSTAASSGGGGGRSKAGPGGPSTASERAEATVSKTKARPLGMGRDTMRQRRAYDRLEEEAPTTLLSSPSHSEGLGAKRRKARHGYAKGGMVSANCGASMKPKRG